ncbi:MAG TPA: tyrosine-protein phosphatase [Blastocatellia bacterium]
MTIRLGRWHALLAAIAVLSLAAAAQEDRSLKETLPNFHQVNENLYRGAQPRRGGVKKLSELGIKTIVNLRGASDDTRKEQAEAEASGMRYFNIPMSSLGRPADEQVERALAVIDARENWPVFVHCKRGADRTGVIIAAYRISRDRWTAEQAVAEAKRFGLAFIQFGKKSYISDYYRRRRDAPK